MNFFNIFNNKEERHAPTPSLSETLENQSYCDVVKKQVDFLSEYKDKVKYKAMNLSAVFAAVNLISNSISQMPWYYKQDGEIIKNSFIDTLNLDTNTTHFMLVKNMIKDMLLWGDGFAYIKRDKYGIPESLYYLQHGQCSINYNPLTNSLYYIAPIVSAYDNTVMVKLIEPKNILHFVMNTKDGIQGESVLSYAKNTVNLSGYVEKNTSDYFLNEMKVDGIIKSSGPIGPKQRKDLREGWKQTEGNIRVLEGGLEYQSIQSTAKEAELLEQRKFNVLEVARFFQINPVLLGDLDHSVYGTIEQAQREFVSHTLQPYVMMMEEELNKKLLLDEQRDKGFYVDIDEESIVKTDYKTNVDTMNSLVDKGIITRNEARIKLGLKPIEDEFADKLVLTYKNQEEDKNTESKDNEE